MTGNEKFRLKVVDDLRKNRVIVESDEEYIALLKKANKDLGDLVRERDEQLAASQAQIKVLRDALESSYNGLLWWMDAFPLHATEADNEEMLLLVKALALPHDDSALQAAILAEREACAVVCEKLPSLWPTERVIADECAAAIRAR